MQKNLFLIIGAPGSGKTTDAALIAKEENNFSHYSTGDLLREEVASKSELGVLIHSFISKGNLVPLTVVIDTIFKALKKAVNDNIIIDGYPRSVEQMLEFDKVLQEHKNIQLQAVIEIQVSDETAKNRVLGRNRGDDDKEEVFYTRMQVYKEPLEQIRTFYQNKALYMSVDGERSIENIVSELKILIKTKI